METDCAGRASFGGSEEVSCAEGSGVSPCSAGVAMGAGAPSCSALVDCVPSPLSVLGLSGG